MCYCGSVFPSVRLIGLGTHLCLARAKTAHVVLILIMIIYVLLCFLWLCDRYPVKKKGLEILRADRARGEWRLRRGEQHVLLAHLAQWPLKSLQMFSYQSPLFLANLLSLHSTILFLYSTLFFLSMSLSSMLSILSSITPIASDLSNPIQYISTDEGRLCSFLFFIPCHIFHVPSPSVQG